MYAPDGSRWECLRQSISAIELCDTSLEADCNPATSAQPQTKGYPMIVGNFSYDAGRDSYTGEITTLTLQA
jgi:hypothetical protein